MRARIQAQSSRSELRRMSRARARRIQLRQFQSWQRWTPPQTATLVRLVRLLGH